MRRTVAVVALLIALVATGALWCAPAALAAGDPVQVQDIGWWSNRAASLPRGAGKLEVAHDPSGSQSVAALRLSMSGPVDHAIVILNEDVGAVNATTSALRLCAAADAWTPADRGPINEAPAADCARGQLDMTRDATFGRWTVDVGPLVTAAAAAGASTASVIITPVGVKSLGIVDLGFVLPFSTVQLLVPAGAAPATPTVPTTVVPAATVPPPVLAGPVLTPSLPSFTVTVPVTTAPNTPTTTESALPTPGVVIGNSSGSSKPWGRLVWMVPLSALGGFTAVSARRRVAAALS